KGDGQSTGTPLSHRSGISRRFAALPARRDDSRPAHRPRRTPLALVPPQSARRRTSARRVAEFGVWLARTIPAFGISRANERLGERGTTIGNPRRNQQHV